MDGVFQFISAPPLIHIDAQSIRQLMAALSLISSKSLFCLNESHQQNSVLWIHKHNIHTSFSPSLVLIGAATTRVAWVRSPTIFWKSSMRTAPKLCSEVLIHHNLDPTIFSTRAATLLVLSIFKTYTYKL